MRRSVELLASLPTAPAAHVLDAGGGTWISDDKGRAGLDEARDGMRHLLPELRPDVVFISLRSPAEILFAEEAASSGAELNVILTGPQEFLSALIGYKEEGWRHRFHQCCRIAQRITSACSDHASWTRNGSPAGFPFKAQFAEYNRKIHTPEDLTANLSSGEHQVRFAKLAVEFAIELGSKLTPPLSAPE